VFRLLESDKLYRLRIHSMLNALRARAPKGNLLKKLTDEDMDWLKAFAE